ncbi:alpha-D-ribose 1-methylphosphonate 5-phosphate C-P-lyase PhnJ [Alkalihalobacterium chitinilyticum]|uniref:Alpha-D-ribose 1-methylphosphonate 5-phosphate C-P-lyase PhnJ n=1 Tax=Alkalihalobacterium chitinilyticum TaxID=2980103 RepID=A0ABT5VH21_9BACI|nr:alpha-D-ribose 1-methylphosphonate 5-phosphate C-P-lyase PhnJ [Alkalihalobacterium chitinilyticum]MDE5414757.1 alpha-D-ribose 1-methylphosphonate 5-phosphate C-P-lyase PhnJ [Alkalihalobacterium chitinilyticum]
MQQLEQTYNYAFLDEGSKREIRRATLKAVAIPGYQVPFASREMPIGRGWGTGGLQLTLSLIGETDCLKVIDQGYDDSVNAVSIKKLVRNCSGIETTDDSEKATVIQTRHRIPEIPLRDEQILVLQVPLPEPLRRVEAKEKNTKRLHAEMDYSSMWLRLYEDIIHWGKITIGADYPSMVNGRYIFNPSPIPRYDLLKLNQADGLYLFGAGREKKIYAIPPHTDVVPLQFEDYPFEVESFEGLSCRLCGSDDTFLDEIYEDETASKFYQCSDTGCCQKRQLERRNGA